MSQIPFGLEPSLYSVTPRSFIFSLVELASGSRTEEGSAPNKG